MTTNALLLAALALAIALCALCTKLSHRLGIPALALFSLIGMLFGSDGILGIPFADAAMAEQLCSLALVPILFYGGFGTNWKTARPVAGRAILLSSAGVFLTSALTGLFCHLALGMSWWEGMLMGSVVGSTDATSVFSVLRSHKLNCKGGLAPLLEVESGSNDPFAYILTVAILSLKGGEDSLVGLFLAQVGGGVLCGFALGAAAVFLMKRLRFESEGWQPIFTLALALLIYALTGLLGGNGYLAVYIAGILLGNASIPHKRPLVHFFDGATSLLQIAIFFTLGLLSFPSGLPRVLPAGLAALGELVEDIRHVQRPGKAPGPGKHLRPVHRPLVGAVAPHGGARRKVLLPGRGETGQQVADRGHQLLREKREVPGAPIGHVHPEAVCTGGQHHRQSIFLRVAL